MEFEGVAVRDVMSLAQISNYLIVLFAFMLPLSRASVSIAAALLGALFFFGGNFKKSVGIIWSSFAMKGIILFVAFYFLTLLWQPYDSWRAGAVYLVPYLYLLLAGIIMVVLRKRFIPIALGALIVGMAVSEILSYGIYLELIEKSRIIAQNPSPFMHHIQYSTFLAFVALVLLDLVLRERRWSLRAVYLLLFAAMVTTLFLINGRTGQAAFLVGLFVLGFMHFENRLKALILSALLAIAILGAAYALSDNFQERIRVAQSDIQAMIQKDSYNSSLGYRAGMTILSLGIVREHPFFGTGVVDAMPLIRQKAKSEFPKDDWLFDANHLQNQYLQILIEIGMVGFGFFLFMLYAIAKIPLRSERDRNIKYILLSVYLVTMFSDVQLHIQFTSGLFILITGLLLAQSRADSSFDQTAKESR